MKGSIICLTILVFICGGISAETYVSDNDVTEHMMKFARNIQTDQEKEEFQKILKIISFPSYIYRKSFSSYSHARASVLCLTCRSTISSILNMHAQNATQEDIVNFAVNICVTLNIQPVHVCRGIIELNAPILWYILENQPLLSARSICGVLMQSSDPETCPFTDERYDWTIDIPEKNTTQMKTDHHEKNGTIFKVAHISDPHYDPVYEAGGLAKCNEATCCRKNQTAKEEPNWKTLEFDEAAEDANVHIDKDGSIYIDVDHIKNYGFKSTKRESKEIPEEDKAGYWGDYRNCDSPWWAFEDGVDHVVENNDVDYVYFTGDVIDHGVWETSQEMITTSLNDTFNKLKSAFGNKPLYPIIGNHESQPLNQYAPLEITDPEISTKWLYELLVEQWSQWLPNDTKDTILAGGYYTVLVKPGFRIIVLNTNLCYVYNWWIHWEPKDPSGQFAWLVDTLLKAEIANEKIHILSHVPTGGGSPFYVCSREYARIMRRFSDIIVAEFNGHSHNDEFKVYYKEDGLEPFAVAWNGGSLTSYSFINPNYRIYEVDGETYDLIDAHTWIYNLTEANLTPDQRPRWFKEYSFREHYGVDSMNPKDVDGLIKKMVTTDKNLVLDYNIFRGKSYEDFSSCNDNCIKKNLCYMVKMELYNTTLCDNLFQKYNETSSI